jgi:hypothetical protein
MKVKPINSSIYQLAKMRNTVITPVLAPSELIEWSRSVSVLVSVGFGIRCTLVQFAVLPLLVVH